MGRSLWTILAVVVGLVVLYFSGGLAFLGNKWFALVAVNTMVAVVAYHFCSYSNGSAPGSHDRARNHVPAVVLSMIVASLTFVPLGFYPEFWETGDPIFWLGSFLLVGVLCMLMPDNLPAGAFLPWGPLVGSAGLMMRWGYKLLADGRADTKLVFTDPSKVEAWMQHAVFSVGGIGVAAMVTIYIIAVLLGFRAMYKGKILLREIYPNTVLVLQGKVGQLIFIGDASALHVHHHTNEHLAEQARNAYNFHPIHDAQLWGGHGPPPFDSLNWDEQQWADWYGEDDHGVSRLTALADRLDVTAFMRPGRMVMPAAAYPGFPGFVSPFDHTEDGLEPMHGTHGVGKEYIDLRPNPPRQQTTARIVVEHGFELEVVVSYRLRPVWLDLVVECKGREKLINDTVDYAVDQIAQTVGPWLYGFLGTPTADLNRGHVQVGLVSARAARAATPFTRATSMVDRDAGLVNNLPVLMNADRPAFPLVQAIVIMLTIRLLKLTGMHIFDFQIDDVNVAPEHRDALNRAVEIVIAQSVLPEAVSLEAGMVEGKIGAIYAALATGRGPVTLDADQITKVLIEAAKLMNFKGSVDQLMGVAMARAATSATK